MAIINHDDLSKNVFIVEFGHKCQLIPIVRQDSDAIDPSEGESFPDTVRREQKNRKIDICTNACWYDLSLNGKSDVFLGDDPVSANETTNQGTALLPSNKRYGNPSPLMAYVAQKEDLTWVFGMGDIPDNGFYTGIGGMCPLIINGLKYGDGNKYSKVIDGSNIVGEPREQDREFLIQRNNNKYVALLEASRDTPGIGKIGFGITPEGKCYVAVQAHQNPGMTFDDFRDIFINFGCNNAVSGDGSDSVFMFRDGDFVVKSNELKELTMTFGVGFKDV